MITLIWAESKNKIIGKNNKLPWSIKNEMQHFINYTKKKDVLMGRNTWESLPKKPLANRKNIIITSTPLNDYYDNTLVFNNLYEALKDYLNSSQELVIIGGLQIYQSAFKYANKLVVSVINDYYQGDTYAPEINKTIFKLTKTEEHKEFSVFYYERY